MAAVAAAADVIVGHLLLMMKVAEKEERQLQQQGTLLDSTVASLKPWWSHRLWILAQEDEIRRDGALVAAADPAADAVVETADVDGGLCEEKLGLIRGVTDSCG